MSYKKYYEGGWQSGESGGTPITPEALNHMEQGIVDASPMEYAKKVGAPHNLLDNSDFRNPVNQRNAGGTYGAWGGLTIDRWFASSAGATISLVGGGLQLKGSLGHNVSEGDKFSGKKLTLAAKANGEVYCCSGTVSYIGEWKRITSIARNDVFLDLTTGWHTTDNRNTLSVTISTLNDQSIVFEWVALYEGEYTAETLPEYQPKGYAAEFAECWRYYRNYGDIILAGMPISGGRMLNILGNFIKDMRTVPTVASGTVNSMAIAGKSIDSFPEYTLYIQSKVTLRVNFGSTAPTDVVPLTACSVSFSNLTFSADL